MLTDAFGSSRKKRAMISRHRNKIATLDDTVSEAVQNLLGSPQVESPSGKLDDTL